jgi:hypothetical protein
VISVPRRAKVPGNLVTLLAFDTVVSTLSPLLENFAFKHCSKTLIEFVVSLEFGKSSRG